MPHWSHATGKASAPSLRQHELDQVRRVTALPCGPAVSQPLVGTPLVEAASCLAVPILSTDLNDAPRIEIVQDSNLIYHLG